MTETTHDLGARLGTADNAGGAEAPPRAAGASSAASASIATGGPQSSAGAPPAHPAAALEPDAFALRAGIDPDE